MQFGAGSRGRQEILSCLLVKAAWTHGIRGSKVGTELEGTEGMRHGEMLPVPVMKMIWKWPNRPAPTCKTTYSRQIVRRRTEGGGTPTATPNGERGVRREGGG